MTESSQFVEHLQHAAHASHPGKADELGRLVGLTVAALGALLALCAALLGSARTELVLIGIGSSTASMQYESMATKYRMLDGDLEHLRAMQPDPQVRAASNHQLQNLKSDTATAIRAATDQIMSAVTPNDAQIARLQTDLQQLSIRRRAAWDWAESYEGAMETCSHGAEHYEMAEVMVEVAMVLCSVALVLRDDRWWWGALLTACLAVGVLLVSWLVLHLDLRTAQKHIEACRAQVRSLGTDETDTPADEKLP